MEGNYLQVNFANLISITLMAAVGVVCIGGVTAAVKKAAGRG